MKKKLLIIILAIMACLACLVGITACKTDDAEIDVGNNDSGEQGTTQTPPDNEAPVEEAKELISFKTLEVNDRVVYGKVSNATAEFSFINEVATNDGSTFTLSTDKSCKDVIPSKTVDLQVGNNLFYVLAERGNEMKLYTITVRRRPFYTVTFNSMGGTNVASQYVEEDGLAQVQQTTRIGYTFKSWDYDFSKPILKNETITASWTANKYAVNLDVNGGDPLAGIVSYLTFNEKGVLPIPTKKLYVFSGWYYNGTKITDEKGELLSEWRFIEEINLTCEWETIFILNGSELVDIAEVAKSYTDLEIPSDIDGVEIKSISQGVFKDCINLQKITIPKGIETVDSSTFSCCRIQEAILPASAIAAIPKDNLIKITITSGDIEMETFRGCGLTSVTLEESVKRINAKAFYQCENLEVVNIGSGLEYVGNSAFMYCSKLKTINVKSIADWCNISFYADAYLRSSNPLSGADLYVDGKLLTELIVPEGITEIKSYSFAYYKSLRKAVINNVAKIGQCSFMECTNLTEVAIGKNVNDIGSNAFKRCNVLKEVIFETCVINSVLGDTDNAFDGCINLQRLTIKNTVKTVGSYFYVLFDSYRTIDIYYEGDLTSWLNIMFYRWIGPDSGMYELYFNNELVESLIIPQGVTTIPNYAFYRCSSLTSVTMDNSVATIGDRAFYMCSNLTSVTMGNDVTTIGDDAFYSCISLTSVTMGNGVTKIGDAAFFGCSSLTCLTIPSSVTTIGKYALKAGTGLTEINYNGSKEQWESVKKGYDWIGDKKYTIYCTDGMIEIS